MTNAVTLNIIFTLASWTGTRRKEVLLMFTPDPRLAPILHLSVGDAATGDAAGWHTSTSSPGGNSVGRQEIPCLLVRMMFKHVGISVGTLC